MKNNETNHDNNLDDKRDSVFSKPIEKQFEFDADVAAVFDDMLARSVPFYKESQKLTIRFAVNALQNGDCVYDLGCSTASMLLEMEREIAKKNALTDVRLIGLDTSDAMLHHASKKIDIYNSKVDVLNQDIMECSYQKSKVMISNYTLQFVRPLGREKLVQKIYDALDDEGIFIFSEKVVSEDVTLNKELIDCYYDFKKEQGYSAYEIMQKREALENVLIPYTQDENIKMALSSGFKHCEVLFKWSNFATFIAKK
jgi:tRNA (cmo5U34)-methyltransferase